jgi:hypothetical protein
MGDDAKTLNSSDKCHSLTITTRRSVCPRVDCSLPALSHRCRKADCGVEPPPQGCPSDSDPLCRCTECGWLGTAEHWQAHARQYCANIKVPESYPIPFPRAECYPIPSPRAAQHVIELLDLIELKPHDPRHVIRQSDHSEVPITTVGVLRLLHLPLDQRTAAAVTAELAYLVQRYVKCAVPHIGDERAIAAIEAGQEVPEVTDAERAVHELEFRSSKQRLMREHIAAHHAAAVNA